MRKVALLALVIAVPLTASLAATLAWAQGAARTTTQGVYTDAQAKRGAALFADNCAACHGENLEGAGEAPGLNVSLLAEHENQPLGDLYTYLNTQMPMNAPGSLSPANYTDLLAFLLQQNGMKSGTTELAGDEKNLAAITVKSK